MSNKYKHNTHALKSALKANKGDLKLNFWDSQLIDLFTLNNILEGKKINIVLSNLFDPCDENTFKKWVQTQKAETVFLTSYIEQNGCLVVNDPN
jgi:hypothetical protein